MTLKQLRKAHKATPFKPFKISLSDGRTFPVPHPEFLMVVPEPTRTFVVGESDGTYSIIDLALVSSLDFGDGKARRPQGRQRRRR